MKNAWSEIAVGAATVAVFALIFSYATWGRALTELGGYQVNALFHRVDGLVIGSKVRLAGIDVGEVTRLRLIHRDEQAEVIMRVNRGTMIPADSVAAIVSDGLFGDKFVQIDPGGDTRMLASGEKFDYVQDSIDLIGIFQKMVESAEQRLGIDPSQIPQ